MSKRKQQSNELLTINHKKNISSGLDSKKSMNSSDIVSYKINKGKNYQSDYLFEGESEDPSMINRNYWYRGELMQLVPDVLSELENNTEVVIEQKLELLEILTGCETPNRYNVYLLDKDKNKKFLLKCKEESNWCSRNCCPSSLRGYTIKMVHIKNSNKKTDYKKEIAVYARPCTCNCLCCGRPPVIAYLKGNDNNNNNNQEIGRIKTPCGFGPDLEIFGEDGQKKFAITGDYFQCGYCCRDFSLGKCYEVDFWIYEANVDIKNSKPVGNIHKVFKGLSELITDSDAYILTFPKNATAIERLHLIAAVTSIDYNYYESLAMCDCASLI